MTYGSPIEQNPDAPRHELLQFDLIIVNECHRDGDWAELMTGLLVSVEDDNMRHNGDSI